MEILNPATGAGPLRSAARVRFPPSALLMAMMFALAGASPARGDVSREYQLKAVLLFNLIQYTEWPTNTFATTNVPIVIGVLGENNFGTALDEAVRGETVQGRSIVIEHYDTVREARSCHLLFVSSSERRRFEKIIEQLDHKPILTVSDANEFVSKGGIIRLFNKPDGKVGLRINAAAAKAARLTLSAKLLTVAEVVGKEDD